MRRAAVTVLVLALIGGTTTAFALTQSLKLRRSPVTKPQFDRHLSPDCDCAARSARLAFVLRTGDTVEAVVLNAKDEVVRTLADGLRRPQGRVELVWDGRDDAGRVVPDGVYRLRLHLSSAHRTIVMPPTVTVDTVPPRGVVLAANHDTISPDGDLQADRVRIAYRVPETARAELLVNGTEALQTRFSPAGSHAIVWSGRLDGRAARAATYTLALRFVDRTGNVSDPTPPIRVRVRYIDLSVDTPTVVRGGRLRFSVGSDAARIRWALRHKGRRVLAGHGTQKTVVRLPHRLRPGGYTLRVELRGHADRGTVRIVRRR